MVFSWQYSGSPGAVQRYSNDSQILVKWQSNGSHGSIKQVAVQWQMSGHSVLVEWWSSGTGLTMDWVSGFLLVIRYTWVVVHCLSGSRMALIW